MNPRAHGGLPWVYDDGGRAAAGYRGEARDCVTRAVAIATGAPYREVYAAVNEQCRAERAARTKTGRRRFSAREGVAKPTYRRYLTDLGWRWVPTMRIGVGCRVHLAPGELPAEPRLLVSVSRHLVAVIDGTVRDTHDPSRDGTRCVYGYYLPPEEQAMHDAELMVTLIGQRRSGKTSSLTGWLLAGRLVDGWPGWSRLLVVADARRARNVVAEHDDVDAELRAAGFEPGLSKLVLPFADAGRLHLRARNIEWALDDAEQVIVAMLGGLPSVLAMTGRVETPLGQV